MTVEISDSPLFEELKPLFVKMYKAEREKAADWLIDDASDCAVICRARDINEGVHHMGGTPAPWEGSEDDN